MSFYSELRRRNVFKVAIVYLAVAWLLLQISDTLGPALHLPEWFVSAVVFLLILGFPIAMICAWAFDLTPDGLKRETTADPADRNTKSTNTNLNRIVVPALILALGYFIFDKVVLDRSAPEVSADTQHAEQQPTPAKPVESDNSIAVLPFVNMSSDEEQEYFSDGLSEELLNLLAGIPELKVAARTSSFSFKDKGVEITEIAARLKVAHVLEGSVRKHGNQLRITAQLIQADNGYHLWSKTYDRQLDDVFQVQEDIAAAVVDALRVTILGEVPKTRKTDPKAYQLFLEGQYLKRQLSQDALNAAVKAFKQAVEIDPTYVPALAELADTYVWGGGSDELSSNERTVLADQAIATAIDADPNYAFAYYVRGISWFFEHGNFDQGIIDFQHALELDPNDAFLIAAIGKGAYLTGQYDLAIAQYKAALAQEPLVPEFYLFLGNTYVSSGQLDEAEATFETLSSLSPSSNSSRRRWQVSFLRGDYADALAELDTDFSRATAGYALGNSAMADEALAKLIERSHPFTVASVYGYRGDIDKTFEWLDIYLNEGADFFPTTILSNMAFRSVHADDRWPVFLEQLGVLEYWEKMAPTHAEI